MKHTLRSVAFRPRPFNGFGTDGPQKERRKIVTKTSPENVEKRKEVVGKRNVLLYIIVLFFFIHFKSITTEITVRRYAA